MPGKYEDQARGVREQFEAKGAKLKLWRYPLAADETANDGAGEHPLLADYSDQTGAGENDAPTPYDIAVIISPASKGTVEAFDVRLKGQTLIETHLRALKIAAFGLEVQPRPGDGVDYDGERWRLIGCTPIGPDGHAIFYNAAIQRA